MARIEGGHPEGKRFFWRGMEILSSYELEQVVGQIETPEEAQEFLKLYREYTPHADRNIAYVAGRFDYEKMNKIYQLFGI